MRLGSSLPSFLLRRWPPLAVAVCLAPIALLAAPECTKTVLWDRKDKGYTSHFVYGIGVTWDDTILVGCEARVAGADAGEKDLLLKRSTDHGRTWSDDVVIEGRDDHHSWSNPTFVTDGLTTYLFYAYTVNTDIGRVYYRTTTDNGLTWSERTEITSLWDGNPHGWTQHSSIGHGIKKLKPPHRGMVLIGFHHRGQVALPPTKRGYGNDVLRLTPNGWEIAGEPPIVPGRGTNEARLAERVDGSLYLMARQAAGNNQLRARTEGTPSGSRWSAWVTQEDLRGTVCDGGLLRFSDTCHLYSFPSSDAKSAQQRQDLAIAVSRDGGRTWGAPKLLQRGQATYSDLTRDSEGNIYCIYGADGSDFMGDRVYLARFNVEWATGAAAPTIVIDDGDAGFRTSGEWREVAGAPGAYGRHHHEATAATAEATWSATNLSGGNYEVFLRWPAVADAAEATVDIRVGREVRHSESIRLVKETATWRYLATVPVEANGTLEIVLRRAESGPLIADAVMLQRQ
ncbi:exo-alpha-sialidase [Opitutus sp. ER46]|uniref:exo-alpha-sialidase n=1 Tax=Opitutus sp. ER46 TaxID=2161864 RepID=UPI000D3273A2|nr:exo-alpha-sialidase [Opitutus sp. ER46]PTX97872.1 hypothetical protein DB354_06220 [Opitutus sp. ER46]